MEQWQFLIQKQGDRTWHPLESRTVEIMEGRYRVVACSHRANTDVDVRITHSSPPELSLQRRIYKRSRRTNNDGSMAVIPFTYFQPGLWELRCSGDLMSDVLGRSWQHLVNLKVLSQPVDRKGGGAGSREQREQSLPNTRETGINPIASSLIPGESNLPIPPIPPNFVPVATESLNPISESVLSSVTETTDIIDETSIHTAELNLEFTEKITDKTGEYEEIGNGTEKPSMEAEISIEKEQEDDDSQEKFTPQVLSLPLANPSAQELSQMEPGILVPLAVKGTDLVPEVAINSDITPEYQLTIYSEEDISLEQPISPVWVKGDTAEQILQNLVDLALPVEEALLEDKVIAKTTVIDTPLPLIIHLDQQSYIGNWGQALTVMGLVQLEGETNPLIDDTSEFESVAAGEIRLELRSPDQLQVLAEVKQPLPERLLPFAISSTIEIPRECESKLLLADIYLYGALGGVGESQLLASQSFIITADVSELIAVSMAKPSAPDMLNDSLTGFAQNVVEEKPTLSLDLELFNLAKTAKNSQSRTFQTSPKRSIPLDVEPVRNRRINSRSPQLPFSPHAENFDPHLSLGANSSASFPYLRKLPLLPSAEETISSNLPDTLPENFDLILSVDSPVEEPMLENHQLQVTDGHLGEIIIPRQPDEYSEVNLPIVNNSSSFDYPHSSQLIAEGNPYVSPLIRKWMQNQGYPVPQFIDFPPQNYQASVPQITENVVEQVVEISPATPELPHGEKIAPTTWVMEEIVVDDDLFEEVSINDKTSNPVEVSHPPESIDTVIHKLPETSLEQQNPQPLPVPQLFIPQGELVAGKLVRIRVELNETLPDVAVKLWVEDCQTRWLLDGPHLITDLIENHLGGMEAISEFNVPFGCIEVRVEAIALHLNTQQESHKTTVQRTVVPPDLPSLQFDEILGM
ncbi:hypothetical protein [Calothrix sp. PCC 6303]|uniref:hypothetical protein n=1 Tax=Calothrix sp. PCC 6303 TaxID=1170562 RepID=UPI0002A02E67|nr:hypothetical protein [Calothrix sp. PCC 6303]AFY99889.1 hypothetical protein Cal6303_0824 [Calothrix sp. PCC 6303]